MTRRAATLSGLAAILLWALLARLTVATAPVPPLQLNALCFALGAAAGLGWVLATGGWRRLAGVSPAVALFGVAGIGGYHLLYFSALRLAPPAEAGLVAYLWPLLIVLFSGLLPGERLAGAHVAGAGLGFLGAGVILSGSFTGLDAGALPGLGLALLAAFTWAGYSVLSRRLARVPTESVVLFCAGAALASGAGHLAFETTAWPAGPAGWIALLLLGLGPVGLAFYFWDVAMKRGDIQMLGVLSYSAPLLSTLILVATGAAEPRLSLAVAAVLITGGAYVASRARRDGRA